MPYEHRNTAQGATALPSRQLPVDPPDPKGVSEADLDLLPPDGEEFLIPYSGSVDQPYSPCCG